MTGTVEDYVSAGDRENTVRSYASALKNFELVWKGMLPATSDSVARYLAEHAQTYRISTLRLHLAALARWHAEHGFGDPTRSPLVHRVLRGIRARHAAPQKQARPLQLEVLEQVSNWLLSAQTLAQKQGRHAEVLRYSRDRSLLLLGFWRAFRADELVHMRFEEVVAERGKGLTFRPGRTKTTEADDNRAFYCPALSRLCPVDAYLDWVVVSGRTSGPVYSAINRWGQLADRPMATRSLVPMLRRILQEAGATEAGSYSSHSLRRGFAGWASANGWDLKELMEHVGWRDVSSAMRYVDIPQASMKAKFERALARSSAAPTAAPDPQSQPVLRSEPSTAPGVNPGDHFATVHLRMLLTKPGGSRQGVERTQRQIESIQLARYGAQKLDREGKRFELRVPFHDRDSLDDAMLDLLDELYRVATDGGCMLEASLAEPATDSYWD